MPPIGRRVRSGSLGPFLSQSIVVFLLGAALMSGGCISRRAPTPMASLVDLSTRGPAACLVVFLPGIRDRAAEFERQHFVEMVRARALSVDLVSADATFGYYAHRTLMDRLATDVIEPRRRSGYRETWLVGISLGGFGSLAYARTHPGDVHGVFALSPYLGNSDVADGIRAAGGLARWIAPAPAASAPPELDVWRWLQDVTVRGRSGPDIYLGWGDRDRFRADNALLGAALPADRVFHTAGRHTWDTWRRLLAQWLEHSTFAARCHG